MLALIEQYFWILFISMVPLIELRGAIPVGVAMGNLPLLGIYIAAIIGNMLPVPIILLFAKKVLIWCTKLPYVGKFFGMIYNKGVKAGTKMQEKAGRGLTLRSSFSLPFRCPVPAHGQAALPQPCWT